VQRSFNDRALRLRAMGRLRTVAVKRATSNQWIHRLRYRSVTGQAGAVHPSRHHSNFSCQSRSHNPHARTNGAAWLAMRPAAPGLRERSALGDFRKG
jgi:hypothetical protein